MLCLAPPFLGLISSNKGSAKLLDENVSFLLTGEFSNNSLLLCYYINIGHKLYHQGLSLEPDVSIFVL